MSPLEVVQIAAGEQANFSYLIYSTATLQGVAIDPSFAPEALLDRAARLGVKLELLINTHGHRDHCAGNGKVLSATGAKLAGHPLDIPQADLPLEEGGRILLGDGAIEVLHTPGHTPGSICLHAPGLVVTGDTLFVTRCGRADLPGSDVREFYRSLRRLAALPPETRVYPGHDYGPRPVSTIAFEREHNPYLRCPDPDSFTQLRQG